MVSQNYSQEPVLASGLLGESAAVRIALWLISSLALVSNLALIVSRCYTRVLRQKPLSIFITAIALSNMFVTTSVIILLAADVNQSSNGSKVLGQGNWSQGICSPVYFLKHFGIHSLVFILIVVVMERFVRLGYHRCFPFRLTACRSLVYICETWVLSFLFIIVPWTGMTKWHRMCTASYGTYFALVTYFVSGCVVIGLCIFAVVLVTILFRRQIRADKLGMREEPYVDLGLIIVVYLTLFLLGIPHGVAVIGHFAGTTFPETGAEVVTILLAILCALSPVLFARYYPTVACLGDSFSSNSSCDCGKCTVDQNYPKKYSLDTLRPPKSSTTLSSFQVSCNSKKCSTTITSTASEERMSIDSIVELNTWNSQSTKTKSTKSWVEGCDYDDLKKIESQTRIQAPRSDVLNSVPTKQRALTWSNENLGNSSTNLESGEGFSAKSVSMSSERNSSFHEAIHEHAILRILSPGELTSNDRDDSNGGRTSDSIKKLKRLGPFKGILQRALSPRRQRSTSLPEDTAIRVKKVERSLSMPFSKSTLDKYGRVSHTSVNRGELDPGIVSQQAMTSSRGHENSERQATFFVLAPAKSPKVAQKTGFSPRKTKGSCVMSPSRRHKSSIEDKIAKSFSLDRGSPSNDRPSPAKTINLEEGDILTELPIMRRQKMRTKPRDPTARDSTCSNSSTGSTTTRFSMEWDPIGSVEGYAEREVLPPYPPVPLRNHVPPPPPNCPEPSPVVQTIARCSFETLPERYSSYSLDWDPTSVQLRNSVISRDSLSLEELSDSEGSACDTDSLEDGKGTSVWV